MIKLFTDALNSRFETLERNIKSKSNSFYDSYLDLLEETIKYFLIEENINFDETRTCGFIVKTDEVKYFFLNTLNLDDSTYNKLPDYIKKCNDHKHKKEKCLQIESVINFLKVYFVLINYYLTFKRELNIEFDSNYFVSLFGETERLNNQYKLEVSKLKNELKASYEANKLSEQDIIKYKSLLSIKDVELFNLDEQNLKLQTQISILKDIKLNSMEEKLNKAIDMLNNMNDYLVENRIIARKTSKLIDGKEISDEELKVEREKLKAIKNGCDKSTSVYEKLDLQGDKIEDISTKLEGININDLYVLAKRTWDYGDFKTAQKYYNHISFLKPLDWEAPLYASLCNFKGHHSMLFWVTAPEQQEEIIVSTIKYINELSIDEDKKNSEMSRWGCRQKLGLN